VDKLYHSILGREGDAEGQKYWLGRLRRSDTIQVIINDFIGSAEYRQKVVNNVVPHPVFWPSNPSSAQNRSRTGISL
jgi:Domain of unknown function (DUF4214)